MTHITADARRRNFCRLTLEATPNAAGFVAVREKLLPSTLAKADLRCVEMALQLH
ncbi:hypothetical protein [Klebsiella sp.]|uniref:hypothetical protein n=1 Tax=Klebsiella/Raoultella group TaxID=2890311 RepID=UPI001D0F9DF8